MNRKIGLTLSALVILAICAGCERKFTRQNYNMITIGTDQKYDVEKMIGPPNTVAGDMWYYEDEDDHYSANIYFNERDVVINKEWMDGMTGEFSGQNPHANPPPKGEVRDSQTRTRTID